MSSSSNINTPSVRVVELVAEREETSPLTLSPPLADFIDPDALDGLFEQSRGAATFEAWGYRITVDADGTVAIEDETEDPEPRAVTVDD